MKIQILAAISSDGYLLHLENHINNIAGSKKYGLRAKKGKNDLSLHKESSLISLLEEKRQLSDAAYFIEATSDNLSLIKGLFLYQLADELIIYQIPCLKETEIRILELPTSKWVLKKEMPLKNGYSCLIYHLI
jgi:hypothetical protein